jgi:hypothetical protein
VARLSERLREHEPAHRTIPRRFALASALTATVLVLLAAVGGIGYAASGAAGIVNAAKELSGSDKSTATAKKDPAEAQYTTTICHRTGSSRNPWVEITVSNSALPTHSAHGDIIPAPPGGCPS